MVLINSGYLLSIQYHLKPDPILSFLYHFSFFPLANHVFSNFKECLQFYISKPKCILLNLPPSSHHFILRPYPLMIQFKHYLFHEILLGDPGPTTYLYGSLGTSLNLASTFGCNPVPPTRPEAPEVQGRWLL